MRTILIHFGDSDFGRTFRPLLDTVWNVLVYLGEKNLTKDRIKDIIMKGIEFHYYAFQFNPSNKNEQERYDFIVNYLKSPPIEILFDEDAGKFIEKNGDSGSWYLEVQSGKVYYC